MKHIVCRNVGIRNYDLSLYPRISKVECFANKWDTLESLAAGEVLAKGGRSEMNLLDEHKYSFARKSVS